jgi:hypothetical protein
LFFTRLQDRDITTKGFRPVWATTTERLLTFDALKALVFTRSLDAFDIKWGVSVRRPHGIESRYP